MKQNKLNLISGVVCIIAGLAALSLFAISPEITSKSPEISLAIGIIPILEGIDLIAKAYGKERQISVIIALFALIPVVLYVIVDTNEMLFLMGLLVSIINAINMRSHQKTAKSYRRHV